MNGSLADTKLFNPIYHASSPKAINTINKLEKLFKHKKYSSRTCESYDVYIEVEMIFHWFKYKVPIDDIWKSTLHDKVTNRPLGEGYDSNFWHWLNAKYDVGQYYNWKEERNYLVFHDKNHYLMFLLKL